MNQGFFKLQRRFFSHALWVEDREFSRAEAFLDLLQLAAFAHTKKVVNGTLVELNPGELCGSVRYLSERWKWSVKKVRTYLALLAADKMIDVLKKRSGSIIRLNNYAKYAGLDTPEAHPGNAGGNAIFPYGSSVPGDSGQTKGTQKGKPKAHQGHTGGTPRAQIKEREEREENPPFTPPAEIGESKPKSLCTLEQARAFGPTIGLTADQAEFWWHTREASGWRKGTAGGGHSVKIHSWQSDLSSAQGWVCAQHHEQTLQKSPGKPSRNFNSSDFSL